MCNYTNGVCDICGINNGTNKVVVVGTPKPGRLQDYLSSMMEDDSYTVILTPAIEFDLEYMNNPTDEENTNNQSDES